jgi:hypothetical protein
MLCSSSTYRFYFFGKKPISQILVTFQSFLKLIVFGKILAVLGKFYCIGSGLENGRSEAKILKTF